MKLSSLVCFTLLMPASGAVFAAGAVTFALSVATSKDVHYVCKNNKDITVSYVNATNGDSFAYLPVDGTEHVFIGVTSASGARYASGRHIWWNKGDTATLSVDDNRSAPLLSDCNAQK